MKNTGITITFPVKQVEALMQHFATYSNPLPSRVDKAYARLVVALARSRSPRKPDLRKLNQRKKQNV